MWITFSVCAAESGDSTSDSKMDFGMLAVLLAQSAWWRGKPSHARSWEKRCKKEGWTSVLSGAVISTSFRYPGCPESTGTSEAIPASPFPKLVCEEGRTIGDTCGPPSSDSSLFSGQEECFSRTWRDTSHSVSVMCFQTWKDLVFDVRSACTQRRKSALPTNENGSLSSAWPTPVAADSRQTAKHTTKTGVMHDGTTLVDAVRLWPTPTANEDAAGTPNGKMQKMLGNHPEIRGPLGQENRKRYGNPSVLSPQFVEALMCFPIGWTDCGRSATRSSRRKRLLPSSDSGDC